MLSHRINSSLHYIVWPPKQIDNVIIASHPVYSCKAVVLEVVLFLRLFSLTGEATRLERCSMSTSQDMSNFTKVEEGTSHNNSSNSNNGNNDRERRLVAGRGFARKQGFLLFSLIFHCFLNVWLGV